MKVYHPPTRQKAQANYTPLSVRSRQIRVKTNVGRAAEVAQPPLDQANLIHFCNQRSAGPSLAITGAIKRRADAPTVRALKAAHPKGQGNHMNPCGTFSPFFFSDSAEISTSGNRPTTVPGLDNHHTAGPPYKITGGRRGGEHNGGGTLWRFRFGLVTFLFLFGSAFVLCQTHLHSPRKRATSKLPEKPPPHR